ncbi:MAG: undecaprenyl-diphosphate phosphatase [Dehalococcoidia bacterium]
MRDALLLGAVQGLTEFLPVSSSAHLVLARRLLGIDSMPRAFDVALHAGTAAALLAESGRSLLPAARSIGEDMVRHGTRLDRYRPASLLALRLGLATIPAVAAGMVYHADLEAWAKHPRRIVMALAMGSLPIALAEAFAARGQPHRPEAVPAGAALLMGIAQVAALAPGISRSGATVAAGMFAGLDRDSATRFSFLLAVPVTVAATARSVPAIKSVVNEHGAIPLAAAIGSALLAGLAGLEVMKRVTHARGLLPFALYRLAVAGLWQPAASRDRRQAPTRSRRDRSAPR